MNDLFLFCCRNTFSAAAVVLGFAVAYFNKNQYLLIVHDQVNFTLPTTVIASDKFKTLLLKKVQRLLLCLLANGGAFSALPKGCHHCGRRFMAVV